MFVFTVHIYVHILEDETFNICDIKKSLISNDACDRLKVQDTQMYEEVTRL